MNSEKTTIPSFRNIEWRTVKTESNKINQVLPYISTNNITGLDELIYAGAKLVCEKIGIPSKSTKKKSKQGWEIRLEMQIKISTKTTGCKKKRTILEKNMATKKHNGKTEWINNMIKELEGLEEGPKAEIPIDLLKTILKKYQTGKRLAMMEYMVSGSKNSPPFTTD